MVKINEKILELKRVMQIIYFLDLKVTNCDCVGNLMDSLIRLTEKTKYVYLDRGTSGKYLIDSDNIVYEIKGYGKKGYCVNHIDKVIKNFEEKIKYMERNL